MATHNENEPALLYTLKAPAEAEYRVERSVFIAQAAPVVSQEEAAAFIDVVRKRYHDATHNPYAYRLGLPPQLLEYFHDHGEPGGTAGRPILGELRQHSLTNTAMVVTRYFGGKKLGVRGLIDAYREAAAQALHTAILVPQRDLRLVSFSIAYAGYDAALHLCQKAGASILESRFGERAELVVSLPAALVQDIAGQLATLGAEIKETPSR